MHNAIIITFEPDSGRLCGELYEKLFIYYCNDDHEAKGFWWNRKNSIIKRESELILKSDLVLCLTEGIANTRKIPNKCFYILPNGVNEGFIKTSSIHSNNVLLEKLKIKNPIIGYFGMIDSRLDVPLLISIAEKRKDWSYVFIGPISGKMDRYFERLCKLNNTYFLGSILPIYFSSYIQNMDVCLIPSIVSDRTKNVLSLKLFEYAALGKPIVSTDMPELRRYNKYVKVSRNAEEFYKNIDDSLKYWTNEQRLASIAFAAQNTWKHRVEELSCIIRTHIEKINNENCN